jgi:hypothetical protein
MVEKVVSSYLRIASCSLRLGNRLREGRLLSHATGNESGHTPRFEDKWICPYL